MECSECTPVAVKVDGTDEVAWACAPSCRCFDCQHMAYALAGEAAKCPCPECVEYRASVEAERDAMYAQRAADDEQVSADERSDFGGADWRSR